MSRNSTLFQRPFFNDISMGEKSMSFWCTLFDVILLGENSTLFRRYLISVISVFSTYFWWLTNRRCFNLCSDTFSMDEKLAHFRRAYFDLFFERSKKVLNFTFFFNNFVIVSSYCTWFSINKYFFEQNLLCWII